MHLELEESVRCSDGVLGSLAEVAIDRLERRVTHLLVRPRSFDGMSRLVPINLAEEQRDRRPGVELGCSLSEARELAYAREYHPLRAGEAGYDDSDWDLGLARMIGMPDSLGGIAGAPTGAFALGSLFVYDRVPKGEAEIGRTSEVRGLDGRAIGTVDGLLVDARGTIDYVLVGQGHLWWRRVVTLPIDAVAAVEEDALTLRRYPAPALVPDR